MNQIRLRPHHGLCIQHYAGSGYDERFIKNMDQITEVLTGNPFIEVVLCKGADVVCACCPHDLGGVCKSEEKAAGYDRKCLALSGFHEGQHLTWDLLRQTLADEIIKKSALKEVCGDCIWFELCDA